MYTYTKFLVYRRRRKTTDTMPGHIKLTKTGQPDPDPTEYLVPSIEMKRADQQKVLIYIITFLIGTIEMAQMFLIHMLIFFEGDYQNKETY
jgi:hypothetical protein